MKLTSNQINNAFSDFCEKWNYDIEFYDERIGMLLLKRKCYLTVLNKNEKFICIDFMERTVSPYTQYNHFSDLFFSVLSFGELSDLYYVLNFIFKNLDMEK